MLAAHALAWQIAVAGLPALALARAGAQRVAWVSVPQRAQVPTTSPDDGFAATPVAPQAPTPTPTRPVALARVAPRAPGAGGGVNRRTPPVAMTFPVYPTRPPPAATLRYALVQTGEGASAAGGAELEWRRDAATFSLRLATRVAERPPREWQSSGSFDAAGVAPLRLVEREKGRDRRTVSFDRERGVVRFSGASGAPAVARGAQDRWSWIAQLAAIAEADARGGQRAGHWDLQVAGLRGELERWTFRVLPPGDPPPELRPQGNELSASGDQAPALLHVLRAPSRPYDLRIEAWLSPSLHHLPVGLRMSTPPSAWSLSLWQRAS